MSAKVSKSSMIKTGFSDMKLPRPFRPREMPAAQPKGDEHVNPHTASTSLNTEERGSTANPVQNEQGSKQTGFKTDGVQNEPCTPSLSASRGSNVNPVHDEPGTKSTPSKVDPVRNSTPPETATRARFPLIRQKKQLKPTDHFTPVPNCLLREVSRFSDPNDFMIYLKMLSFSFGFGRNVCHMGLDELTSTTGLGRNTIRRSIERLVKEQWIKLIEDYEAGQIARQWRVFSPWEKGLTPEPDFVLKTEESTGSVMNPVQNSPGPASHPTGSNLDPPTGSKMDTYKESIQRNSQRNSLSCENEKLAAYFSELKPARKRESEWHAFQELKSDYSEADIASCLDWVSKRGTRDGSPCHSPMAFLAIAMREVLELVRVKANEAARRSEALAQTQRAAQQQADQEAADSRDFEIQVEAFRRFHAGREESEVISEIARKHGFPISSGQIGRSFAISHWWRGLTDQERSFAKQEAIA